jgi:hypothetical protein
VGGGVGCGRRGGHCGGWVVGWDCELGAFFVFLFFLVRDVVLRLGSVSVCSVYEEVT